METITSPETIRPYRIGVAQAQLDDLSHRLDHVRWPNELSGAGWDYGTPLAYLRDLVQYWRTSYSWREHESALNELPQFITEVDGAQIHFLHIKSPEPDATPLILTHGWPGSIMEFLKVIAPLTDPRSHGGNPEAAFHVVVPSVPGFGFSGPTEDKGWSPNRVAHAWNELMHRLGYERYAAQGGDMGALIAPELGRVAPESVIGIHVNAATLGFMPFGPVPEEVQAELTDQERQRLGAAFLFNSQGSGYMAIQSTRPQTLAYGLTDSPVGQLAWIVEKFKEWSNPAAELPEDAVDRDTLLTNVMLYWLTATGGSSARMYFEAHVYYGGGWERMMSSNVPTAVANFAGDMAIRRWADETNNIVRWNDFNEGGHFAALEAPDLLVKDIQEFFVSLR